MNMILKSGETTAVVDIDEKFVLGCDENEYDIVFNPKNIKRSEPHDALTIIGKTDKVLKIAIVIRHNPEVSFSGLIHGNRVFVTFENDAAIFDVGTGELIRYAQNDLKDEYDFSFLEEL
ncbi:MAG: hypothetical protein IKD39_00655 [Oscillospiraceae bacterium]|nr:hypothetical protein [Oscillospiraceae bacterium]